MSAGAGRNKMTQTIEQLEDEALICADCPPLWWDSSYEIAQRLMATHPTVNADDVGLQQVFDWVIALPEFADDPALVNDAILQDILREWYEESNPICLN